MDEQREGDWALEGWSSQPARVPRHYQGRRAALRRRVIHHRRSRRVGLFIHLDGARALAGRSPSPIEHRSSRGSVCELP
jgi:hypothetical protein